MGRPLNSVISFWVSLRTMEIQTDGILYFENFWKETGWGLYHRFVLGAACASHFALGVTFVTMTYAAVLSSCDKSFISETNALGIFTSYLLGCAVGGLIVNFLSDRYGRKKFLEYSFMCIFISSFVAAFAYNIYVIIGIAFILGIGLEANAVIMKLLLIEILNKKRRGLCMVFCNMFWTIGYVLTIFLVFLFESPNFLNIQKPTVQLTMWKIMFAASGSAHLILACVCALIEESPRYFLHMGRNYMAFLLMKQIYAISNSSFAENFKLKEDDLKNLVLSYDLTYPEPQMYWKVFTKLIWRFGKSLQLIFSNRFCQTTWILMFLKIPVIIIGFPQLNILLAKQLAPTNADGGYQKYRQLDFVHPIINGLSYLSNDDWNRTDTNNCGIYGSNTKFFQFYLLLGCVSIPGQIICMFIIDRLGRRLFLFAGLLLTSCSFLTMVFATQKAIQITASCIIAASIGGVISVISLANLELYPTALRGTSSGLTSFPSYLLAIFLINFIVIEHPIINIILGVLYFCLSIFTCLLPDLKGKPMVE